MHEVEFSTLVRLGHLAMKQHADDLRGLLGTALHNETRKELSQVLLTWRLLPEDVQAAVAQGLKHDPNYYYVIERVKQLSHPASTEN